MRVYHFTTRAGVLGRTRTCEAPVRDGGVTARCNRRYATNTGDSGGIRTHDHRVAAGCLEPLGYGVWQAWWESNPRFRVWSPVGTYRTHTLVAQEGFEPSCPASEAGSLPLADRAWLRE